MGGAIFNLYGSVALSNSTLAGNSARGGASGTAGQPDGAQAGSGFGGAIFNLNGSVAITSSTLASNSRGW